MKKTSKKLFASILMSLSLVTIGSSVAHAETVSQPPTQVEIKSNGPSPQSDIIGWRYKTENGQLYRRQYNYSQQKWIGEWEAC